MSQEWTQTIDTLYTTTWAKRLKGAVDQIFQKTPLLSWLKSNERVTNLKGYSRIEIPVNYAANTTNRWISKGDTIPLDDTDPLTMIYEEWKTHAINVKRSFEDDTQNAGAAKFIDIVTNKLKNAESSTKEELERALNADGTGSKEVNGLQNLIATDPTTGTIHGINRANESWFRNLTTNMSGEAASVYLEDRMRSMVNQCSEKVGAGISNLTIYTDRTVFELYEDEVTEQKLIVNKTAGDLAFETFNYKGRPMFWSPSAPSGEMRFINTDHIRLYIDPSKFMDMTEWKSIPDQLDRVAQIVCRLNLCVDKPSVHGVIYNISASGS